MDNERFIDDLFEAARQEPVVRPASSVEQFIQNAPASSTSNLIVQWLKQYKMNILITTSGIMVTAAILLFPEKEITEKSVITQLPEISNEQVVEQESEIIEEVQQETEKKADSRSIQSKVNQEPQGKTKQPAIEPAEPVKATEPVRQVASKQKTSSAPKKETVKKVFAEYQFILESRKGKSSADAFQSYLNNNLKELNHEFTSSSSKKEIKKFNLKLDNRLKANFRMQVAGFETLELHWESSSDGEIKNMWYRIDSKEIKNLDFSKDKSFSVSVKHKHQEF